MNTIKTLALATIIIGMASCASTPKFQMVGAFGKSTKLTSEEDSLFKAVKKKVEVVVYEPLPGQGDARILSIGGKEYTE